MGIGTPGDLSKDITKIYIFSCTLPTQAKISASRLPQFCSFVESQKHEHILKHIYAQVHTFSLANTRTLAGPYTDTLRSISILQ